MSKRTSRRIIKQFGGRRSVYGLISSSPRIYRAHCAACDGVVLVDFASAVRIACDESFVMCDACDVCGFDRP